MRTRTRGTRSDGVIYVDTEVEIRLDGDDLADYGYHHEDDCNGSGRAIGNVDAALDQLHREAGHGEFPIYVCTKEPCRSLYLMPAGSAFTDSRKAGAA